MLRFLLLSLVLGSVSQAERIKALEVHLACKSMLSGAKDYQELLKVLPSINPEQGEALKKEADRRFFEAGGYSLVEKCDGIRFAVFQNEGGFEFYTAISGDFKGEESLKAVDRAYSQVLERIRERPLPEPVRQSIPEGVSREGSDLVLATPGVDRKALHAGLRPYETGRTIGIWADMSSLPKGQEERSVDGFNLEWTQTDLGFEVHFARMEMSAMAAGMAGGVLQAAAASPWQTPEVPTNLLLDRYSYAMLLPVYSHFEKVIKSARLEQMGNRVSLSLPGIGSLKDFVFSILPVTLAAASNNPMVMAAIQQKLAGMGQGGFGAGEDDFSDGDDDCLMQLDMASQALDFYNLDHGTEYSWEAARQKLFDEGYLPRDLNCGPVLLMEPGVVLSTEDGALEYGFEE